MSESSLFWAKTVVLSPVQFSPSGPKENLGRSSRCGAAETNPTRNNEIASSIPGLAQWVKDLVLL